jgi:hypothetical protein
LFDVGRELFTIAVPFYLNLYTLSCCLPSLTAAATFAAIMAAAETPSAIAGRHRASFIDRERPALKIRAIELRNGVRRFLPG